MPLVSLYTAWKHTSFLFPLDSLKVLTHFMPLNPLLSLSKLQSNILHRTWPKTALFLLRIGDFFGILENLFLQISFVMNFREDDDQ